MYSSDGLNLYKSQPNAQVSTHGNQTPSMSSLAETVAGISESEVTPQSPVLGL